MAIEKRVVDNYGSGQSGVVLVEQHGPTEPSEEQIRVAEKVARGDDGYDPPCLDCGANLVLVDYVCTDCKVWHWGYVAAHDDTCPALRAMEADSS